MLTSMCCKAFYNYVEDKKICTNCGQIYNTLDSNIKNEESVINIVTRILEVMNGHAIASIIYFLSPLLVALLTTYLGLFVDSALACIVNWKKIKATKGQKIMSMFALPLFNMLIAMPTCIVAMFKNNDKIKQKAVKLSYLTVKYMKEIIITIRSAREK